MNMNGRAENPENGERLGYFRRPEGVSDGFVFYLPKMTDLLDLAGIQRMEDR